MGIKIPKLKINIPNYIFDKDESPEFIGRDEEIERLKRRIDPKNKKGEKENEYFGAYLVAGNRGMGKTTLVKVAIREINEKVKTFNFLPLKRTLTKEKKIIPIYVYLSQGVLSDFDLLKQIFIQLNNQLRKEYIKGKPLILLVPIMTLVSLTFFYLSLNIFIENDDKQIVKNIIGFFNSDNNYFERIFIFVFSLLFTVILVKISAYINSLRGKKKKELFNKLDVVSKRLYSSLEIEAVLNRQNISSSLEEQVINSFSSTINKSIGNTSEKQTYHRITPKELEFEIKIILELYKKFRKNKKKKKPLLFVIDELDKLEPEFVEGTEDYLELGKSRLDSRKETITTLLSNLKSFIHTAEAKFIFIGGAEMYDASLADVADRESFYSSIFHEVIYVKSFFKEKASSGTTLTEMIEKYLDNIIPFSEDTQPKNILSIIKGVFTTSNSNFNHNNKATEPYFYYKNIIDKINGTFTKNNNNLSEEDTRKLEFISYQLFLYIIYLTYRSNGSPKKLKELIEYELQMSDDERTEIGNNSEAIEIQFPKTSSDSGKLSLNFGELRQYEIGFLSSIFMPYLLNNQAHLKLFNDNNLYLSAFLMDHILKFHGAAFSWRQLEILPDIILGGNTPDLRDRLKELINYLSVKHIRETTNAMFQYKFRSNVAMELDFLSKISDESAAAFNFSFDESYHLKAFFKRKLKQKAHAYKENGFQNFDNSFLQSLSFLNSTIADLHYYDEEYESSIRYYSDSIQQIMNLMMIPEMELTNHQEVIYTRNSLLMSLCHERSYHYDLAYSSLREVILNISRWKFIYQEQKSNDQEKYINQYFNLNTYEETWEAPYKRMQLFLRPYVALLMLIEKDRSDGMTGDNLIRNIHEYSKFLGICDLFPYRNYGASIEFREFLKNEGDHVRIQTLLADYYQSVGSILFYKNTHIKKVFDAGVEGILGNLLNLKINFKEIKLNGLTLKNINFKKVTENLMYKKIQDIRNIHYKNCLALYIPSFESLLYYITSLGHLTLPYLENMKELVDEEHKPKDLLKTLSVLSSEKNHMRFSGKQKELVGLVTSKLSDSILSCIDKIDVLKNINKLKEIDDKDFWKIEDQYDNFISVKSVFYFNILSYKYFYFAGKKYDALTSLMKCLHILRVHFFSTENDKYEHEDGFDTRIFFKKWLIDKCYAIINASDFSSTSKEKSILEEIEPLFKNDDSNILITNENLEINILDDLMTILLNERRNSLDKRVTIETKYEKLNNNLYVIKSIFTRFQYLRYAANIYYLKNLKFLKSDFSDTSYFNEFCESLEKVESCFDNLFEIMNISGHSYIMNYSYMANFYNNLISWSTAVKSIETIQLSDDSRAIIEKWKYKDIDDLKVKAIMYFEKAINVHTEGDEYKSFIRKMYILEDDLNDARVHFNAALERSLINVGAIPRKLEELKKRN